MELPTNLASSLQRTAWWQQLEPQWQRAFQEVFFKHSGEPSEEELEMLCSATVLRLAGATAPHTNMSFELTNLSGIVQLTNLEILIVTFQQLETVKEVENLPNLISLFVNNNVITSLEGIENLFKIEQVYCHVNKISSLKQVEKLDNLKELYVSGNELSSLEGLTEQHSDTLKMFICLPNDKLSQREIIRVEHQLGIRCKGG